MKSRTGRADTYRWMEVSRRQFVISMAVWPLTIPVRADERTGDIEWHVLFVTNQQRIWRRLGQLEGSDSLALVARAHSQDMLDRHFFDHRSPDGLGPARPGGAPRPPVSDLLGESLLHQGRPARSGRTRIRTRERVDGHERASPQHPGPDVPLSRGRSRDLRPLRHGDAALRELSHARLTRESRTAPGAETGCFSASRERASTVST